MELDQIIDLVRASFAVDSSTTDAGSIEVALAAHGRLENVLAGQRLVLAGALRRVSPTPESDIAATTRSDRKDARKTLERAALTDEAPQFAVALGNGEIRPEHLDRLGGALGRLNGLQGQRLLDQPDLASVAATMSPEDFDRELKHRERQITADDGQALYARQRRAVRLRNWIDDDGMSRWTLLLDPLTGARFTALVRSATETLFHSGDEPPDGPTMPRDRQEFLQAHALMNLLCCEGPRSNIGRPEITVVIDTRVPQGAVPVVDWGIPVDLPASVLTELAARANTQTVIVDGDELICAPGPLDVDRRSRLATPAQRRALRAMYATCAVPGCSTRFDYTVIHHIIEWLPNGLTNLNNLIPVCATHHRLIHQKNWQLTLQPSNRALTIRLPDGRTLHGRPNRAADTDKKCRPPPRL